jgi:hypothetical protein
VEVEDPEKTGTLEDNDLVALILEGDVSFVKFNSQLSALNACNGTNGMSFAGNPVAARFFPTEKFEAAEYA